ncbi:apolipoprotein N-acyltransferase [Gracilinema caldarium]|uniref:Apolipoprotein N-acyltransferase n=1 Tax=Gracilinema caldarium (strain ATCC 51460 / DSM 7334 / H1) TaxID=744872 RepID=F8F0P5_GRAC1|nr:apolipoprotein N-acyltransferase [Gracilinema caldarium]AEJ19752.1 Apolipoprotein N-acyltransferase [Gracilinema caldarium DSM 7334]
MMPSVKRQLIKNNFFNIVLILLAAVLFALSFPNLLTAQGIPFLAWVSYAPVFYLISRISLGASFIWGALYGYTAYGLFNYWLSVFHPLAGLIVGCIYLTYFALLFPLLKLSEKSFPQKYYLVQWLLWLAYEYLRTQGFLGYSYGITGYSQWAMIPLIQIASLFGVWAVSALVVFPSAYVARLLVFLKSSSEKSIMQFVKQEWLTLSLWIIALFISLMYGYNAQVSYKEAPVARLALIQHNSDPWRGGIAAYRQNFNNLKRLSLEAVSQEKKPDFVVWSETAFVPRIYWHKTYRDDPESYELVKDLLDFLATQDIPYVIGNDDARKEITEDGIWDRVDYNAVLLFHKGEEQAVYRKMHLVPFTEHFPYKKQLPLVYEALRNADTHFWKKGTEITVFESNGITFSTPICFEDTFGYISRRFVNHGAQLIVNLTNDAWSKSLPAQMQHATMAVFRAIENRRSVVRSTASGQTCAIDPNGRILAMAPAFTETQLTVDVPLLSVSTWYTKYGDILAQLFVVLAVICMIIGIIRLTIRACHRTI